MKFIVFSAALVFSIATFAQDTYWQQDLSYEIQAQLDDAAHTINGREKIVYKNNSPSTLEFIWFHIYPNAYKNESTAMMRQIRGDKSRSKKAEQFGAGWIEGLQFTADGSPARMEAHPNPDYIDVVKVVLNKPLAPGASVTIETPFKVVLPPYFSRSGYADGEFMATQWYPKPAVFDKTGWHEFPYLDMGEFYSEYANYKVDLTLPADYIVGATGNLLTESEISQYKSVGAKNAKKRKGKPKLYVPTSAGMKTLQYSATNVPDFAWFADKNFVIQYDTIVLPSGRKIDAFSYYHNKPKTIWNNSIDYIEDGIRHYSKWIGEYDYPVVQVVEGPANNSSGGMEYPMVTLITSPDAKVETLDAVIVHEVGHNWFMSMLGSNERDHAWMDEGLNTYYQFRYEAEKYRSNSIFGDEIPEELKKKSAEEFSGIIYNVIAQSFPLEPAMDTPSAQFANSDDYSLTSYIKTALWMYLLEASSGQQQTDAAVQNYFRQWKHKHPQPEDMQKSFEEAQGTDMTPFFELTKKQGSLLE